MKLSRCQGLGAHLFVVAVLRCVVYCCESPEFRSQGDGFVCDADDPHTSAMRCERMVACNDAKERSQCCTAVDVAKPSRLGNLACSRGIMAPAISFRPDPVPKP